MTAVGYEQSFGETFGHVCLAPKTRHQKFDVRFACNSVRSSSLSVVLVQAKHPSDKHSRLSRYMSFI